MAYLSPTALTILYGFAVLFLCCAQVLGPAANALASPWGVERVAATALLPALVITLELTTLLTFAHVQARGGGGAPGVRRLVKGLAKVTFVAATVALLAHAVLQLGACGAVVQIGADGHLDRGRGDVARLNIK